MQHKLLHNSKPHPGTFLKSFLLHRQGKGEQASLYTDQASTQLKAPPWDIFKYFPLHMQGRGSRLASMQHQASVLYRGWPAHPSRVYARGAFQTCPRVVL